MDPAFETLYHRLEHNHWWFRGRRELIRRLAARLFPVPSADVIDIGCASGQLLEEFTDAGFPQPIGLDLSPIAVQACHARGLSGVVEGDATAPPFPQESADLLIASDVLEHLSEDSQALENWLQILRPGGYLIVFVPAFQWLWSEHDVRNHHHRRYTRSQLVAALENSGWQIERSGYWNTLLFPAVATVRLLAAMAKVIQQWFRTLNVANRRALDTDAGNGQLRRTPDGINTACLALLRCENRWIDLGLPCPIGVSTFAIARRPEFPPAPSGPASEANELAAASLT